MRDLEATIISDCRRFKAEIERRATGSFRINVFTWFDEWYEGYHETFWSPVERRVILTDTLEHAMQLARDEFAALAVQFPTLKCPDSEVPQ